MAQTAGDGDSCGMDGSGCGRRGRPATLADPQLQELWAYRAALRHSSLSPGSRQVYLSRLRGYLAWLAANAPAGPPGGGTALTDPALRDHAVAGFCAHLREMHGCKPGTINNYLAAIDHFYTFHRDLGPARAVRERLPDRSPAVLDARSRGRFHEAARRLHSDRDAAICLLLVHSGMSVTELAALDLDDIVRGSRRWHLVLRDGPGQVRRLVTLPYGEVHDTLRRWLRTRPALLSADPAEPALFVGRRGRRLAERTLRSIVTTTAADAGLPITPRQLHVPASSLPPGPPGPAGPPEATAPGRRADPPPPAAGGDPRATRQAVERQRSLASEATSRLVRNLLRSADLQEQAADTFTRLAEVRPGNAMHYRDKADVLRRAAGESRRLATRYADRLTPARRPDASAQAVTPPSPLEAPAGRLGVCGSAPGSTLRESPGPLDGLGRL
ncbi:tyrosine-type recombinase/integrase [Actinomadura sp. 9N407]|uniref:tyrosine-type recombinase/integrase n=1 Tax=Actinomadura sp. 9N407 TaxID=3375154 RepID=UPI0037A92738